MLKILKVADKLKPEKKKKRKARPTCKKDKEEEEKKQKIVNPKYLILTAEDGMSK